MFIKILTPNHNGKIELTVADLEALIQEAVDKAVREDRANRPYNTWYGSTTLLNQNPPLEITPTKTIEPTWDWNKVVCNDNTQLTNGPSGASGINTIAQNGDTFF
jgi:hypothetical protein